MSHKLSSGHYRHMNVLIRHTLPHFLNGFNHEWEVRLVGSNIHRVVFKTLKLAELAIEQENKLY